MIFIQILIEKEKEIDNKIHVFDFRRKVTDLRILYLKENRVANISYMEKLKVGLPKKLMMNFLKTHDLDLQFKVGYEGRR